MDTNEGVKTTFEKGSADVLVGVGIVGLGVTVGIVALRAWLVGLYERLKSPELSADVTMFGALSGVCMGAVALVIFITVAYVFTRLSKHTQAPVFLGSSASSQPQLPAPAPRYAQLRSGNWATTTGGDSWAQPAAKVAGVRLDFADDTSQTVTLEAWQTAMGMPRLTRNGWPHANDSYKAIRRYLIEAGACDEGGVKDHEVCHRLDREVMASVR